MTWMTRTSTTARKAGRTPASDGRSRQPASPMAARSATAPTKMALVRTCVRPVNLTSWTMMGTSRQPKMKAATSFAAKMGMVSGGSLTSKPATKAATIGSATK